jgi:hypothetical protein
MGSDLFVVAFCRNNKIWYWRQPRFEKVVITTIDLFSAIFAYKCRFHIMRSLLLNINLSRVPNVLN